MRYRPLGPTGLHVSALGLGGNQFGTTCDAAQVKRIVDAALELGVNFIDTAEMYGPYKSEETLGQALRSRWNEVVLCTKTGAGDAPGKLSRKKVFEALEASLRRLGTDHVDLYYIHFPDPTTPLDETLRAYEDLVREGKIRYVGISNHAAWQVAEAVGIARRHDWSPVVVSQDRYNILDRGVEAERIAALEHLGLSLVPYSPLMSSFLTGKYRQGEAPPPDTRFGRSPRGAAAFAQVGRPEVFAKLDTWRAFAEERGHTMAELAIAWLLAHPVVCSVIAGVTKPEQVAANAKAAEWELSLDEVKEL
ncbi:MAG: aldo/keto reductase [Chloroflexota bacterium]|nr:aldo/keto reductase [Chloroflexota bacterium]